MKFSSKYIEDAVSAFSSLPGIGKKSALRMALYLLDEKSDITKSFAAALLAMREKVKSCSKCHYYSDQEICSICNNPKRDQYIICVVENVKQVMAIEDTGHFRGVYHVLGGLISPVDGRGPEQINIDTLVSRIREVEQENPEVILALSSTIEGETTSFYLAKQLREIPNVKVSAIAKGVSFGSNIEYSDELTLSRSITTRQPYSIDL